MARPKKNIESIEEKTVEKPVENQEAAPAPKEEKSKKTNELIIDYQQPSVKQLAKEMLNKLIAEETKTVKGRFRNFETPGGSLRVQVRKYPGIAPFDKIMFDNETYEIPLYVARHLNGIDVSAKKINGKIHSCSFPIHGFKWDQGMSAPLSQTNEEGIAVPIIGVSKWTRRFGFESLEFDAAG